MFQRGKDSVLLGWWAWMYCKYQCSAKLMNWLLFKWINEWINEWINQSIILYLSILYLCMYVVFSQRSNKAGKPTIKVCLDKSITWIVYIQIALQHSFCYFNLNSGIDLEFKRHSQLISEWHSTLQVMQWTTVNLRSILACEGVSILGVLDKWHINSHQRGSICSYHLTSDQWCQTGEHRTNKTTSDAL